MSRENVFFVVWILSWVGLLAFSAVALGLAMRVLSYLFRFGWNLI
jgi:hypothetical protein